MLEEQGSSRYEILEEIGEGGMGKVFKAIDHKLERTVAIKRIHPALAADQMAVGRLQKEARLAAALDHPNIVHIYDVGRDEEGVFVVMSYVQGQSLVEILEKNGPMEPVRAVQICIKVGEALSTAHAAEIVHRDVKPANVLITPSGEAMLTDFGIAVWDEGMGEMTRELVGSPEYAAPEQFKQGSKIDARTDIFALAATLYACLTAESPRTVRAYVIPKGLRKVILRALEENPENRQTNMEELVSELRRFKPGRDRRTKTVLAVVVGMVALFVLGAVGAGLMYFISETDQVSGPELVAKGPSAPADSLPTEKIPTEKKRVAVRPKSVSAEVPAVKLSAKLESVSLRKTVSKSGYVFGFVKNTGQGPIRNPRVEMEFFDKQGKSLIQAFGYSEFDLIEAGMRVPIKIVLSPFPKGYTRYETKMEAQPLYIRSKRLAKLSILDKRLVKGNFGSYKVQAVIRNDDEKSVKFAKAVVVLFDSEDKILAIDSGFAVRKEILPGKKSNVVVAVYIPDKTPPARYEIIPHGTLMD